MPKPVFIRICAFYPPEGFHLFQQVSTVWADMVACAKPQICTRKEKAYRFNSENTIRFLWGIDGKEAKQMASPKEG